MPDENSNQLGVAQTSTNQSGNDNDFTLDFGDEEVKNNGETNEVTQEDNAEMMKATSDFNDDNSLNSESSNLEQNEINQETTQNGDSSYDNFDISFDSGDTNLQTDNNLGDDTANTVEEDEKMEGNNRELESIKEDTDEDKEDVPEPDALDYPIDEGEKDDEVENSETIENETNETKEVLEKNEDNSKQENLDYPLEDNHNEDEKDLENNNETEENEEESVETEEVENEDIIENEGSTSTNIDDNSDKDDSEYSLEMGSLDYSNDDLDVNTVTNSVEEDVNDEKVNSNDSEPLNQTEEVEETMNLENTQGDFTKILSDEVKSLESQENPSSSTNEPINYFMDENDSNSNYEGEKLNISSGGENIEQSQLDLQSKLNEESNISDDGAESNVVETNYQSLLNEDMDTNNKAPEYDLSDDATSDANVFNESDNTVENASTQNEENTIFTENAEQNTGLLEDVNNIEQNNEDQQGINLNDYSANLEENNQLEENISENNAEESHPGNENEQPNLESDNTVTNEGLTLEPMPENQNTTNQIEMKSTLSLDQIISSEVQTNPQVNTEISFENNANQNKSSSSNKKMIGIIAGVSFFALAGAAAYLAFPMGNSDRQPNEVVYTDDHGAPTEISEEFPEYATDNPTEPEQTEPDTESKTTTIEGTPSIVEEIFPDSDLDTQEVSEVTGEGESESETGAKPYNPKENIQEEEIEYNEENQSSTLDNVRGKISKYKEQADRYYNYGQKILDKDIIKYSRQIIYLCNEYEKKIENGEGLDDGSISEFESQVKRRMSKIEDGMGSAGESAIIIDDGHLEDGSNFEGKDELKDYLYDRSN